MLPNALATVQTFSSLNDANQLLYRLRSLTVDQFVKAFGFYQLQYRTAYSTNDLESVSLFHCIRSLSTTKFKIIGLK